MKFTTNEFLEKFPLPANGKWKDGVFDIRHLSKITFSPQRRRDAEKFRLKLLSIQ